MSSINPVTPLILDTINAANVVHDAWLPFDVSGIYKACSIIRIINASWIDIVVSFNGVDEHEFLGYRETALLNLQRNSSPAGYVSKFRRGTVIYVRSILEAKGQLGYIYLSGYFN